MILDKEPTFQDSSIKGLFQPKKPVSTGDFAATTAMATIIRVAAAQMTSINDIAANYATCSRLVKVFLLLHSIISLIIIIIS